MAKDFVEKEDNKFADQLGDFAEGLQTHGSTLGFSAAEITDAQDDAKFMKYVVERQTNFQAAAEGFTAFKDLARYGKDNQTMPGSFPPVVTYPPPLPIIRPANIEGRFRRNAAKAKASANYTDSIGEELKIVASKTVFVPEDGKGKIRVAINAGRPDVFFVKGNYDGGELFVDRGAGYASLGRFNHSPIRDDKVTLPPGQTANWKYKLALIFKDKAVGEVSDEVTVTVSGDSMI